MARGIVTITLRLIPGGAVLAALLFLAFGTVALVWARAEGVGGFTAGDWAAIRFTLWQALASAAISVGLAIPVARALARRRFFGRQALVTLLGAPFILPVIVGVLGLLAVFGRVGWISQISEVFGGPKLSIYGAWGVVLAHVFFNLPLATRLILQGWLSIPSERLRLATSLGADATVIRRLVEWPMLRGVLPGAFLLIFLLCLTSFAVALAVGGGPKATTIELAIYQAFRFDFDLRKAALLALVQFGLCLTIAILAFLVPLPRTDGSGLDRTVQGFTKPSLRILDTAWISLAAAFLILPLLAIVIRGVPSLFQLPSSIWVATATSVMIALWSTGLCLAMAMTLAFSFARLGRFANRVGEGIGVLGLATSPLVIGTGLFLAIYPFANPTSWALWVTALVNAAMALPFALRVLLPAVQSVYQDFLRLRDSLFMTRWAWMRWVVLPRLRRPLGFAGGLSAALSMGDLGVVALFADRGIETLPLALYRLMGAYRMDQAASAALLLVVVSLTMFWIFDRGGRIGAAT